MRGKLVILLLVLCSIVNAQEFPVIGQYSFNEMIINPAATGYRGALNGLISYRKQWVNVEGAPSTQNFSIQTPLKKKPNASIGLFAYSDKIGVANRKGLFVNYGYKLKLNKEHELRLGLAGGIKFNRVLYSDLAVNDTQDPNFIENTPLFISPNFSAGVKYTFKQFQLGFSLPMFLTDDFISSGKTKVVNDFKAYNYLVRTLYTYKVNEVLKLIPNMLYKFHPVQKSQLDVNLIAEYNDFCQFGIGYRSEEGVLINLGMAITQQFDVGIQYEIPTSNLAQYKSSSFEILLMYNSLFETKANNPRHY